MKKEYIVVLVLGLFLFAYLLDAVVGPIAADLATPYHYLTPQNLFIYPFSSASLFIKAAGLVIVPVLLLSFFQRMYLLKAASILVLSALYQLYALQQVATNAETIPLEWSLALTLAGLILLIPMVVFLFKGLLSVAHTKLTGGEESVAEFSPKKDSLDDARDDGSDKSLDKTDKKVADPEPVKGKKKKKKTKKEPSDETHDQDEDEE